MTKEEDNAYQSVEFNEERISQGRGGDTHQFADNTTPTLTTQQGIPVSDDANTLRQGAEGPALLEDFIFREKLFHFDHERIPERVVHARGYGVHGYFESYGSFANITMADPLQEKGKKTPVFVRFSTVAGSKGSPDLARDVRGFAVKFYTQQGNWDLVGNNIPVFFIQDAIKFPDLIHAAKEEPDRAFPQAQTAHDNFWDFISLTPESMHMVMWIMSDRTIPRSFRFMEGFGVHTFRLINAEGKSTYVKFHWKPKQGMQSVLWDEAVKINGADPDFHRRDLWNAIKSKDYPEWELGLQCFDEDFANTFEFDVLDATKIIPEELVPVQIVGRMVLDRCVENFFAETEQVAFCTQNVIPGIDFTNDPLLQGRNFSYLDTQLKRLGSPNFTHLPINSPRCPFANFQQDGHMAFYNPKGRANYNPNSWHEGPRENPQSGFQSFKSEAPGDKLRARPEKFADHYSQAKLFFTSQTSIEQQHIADALVFELSKVETPEIRQRMVSHLLNIDIDLAKQVGQGLGLKSLPKAAQSRARFKSDLEISPKLSILANKIATLSGREIGLLISGSVDANQVKNIQNMLASQNAKLTVIASQIDNNILSDGSILTANQKIGGAPSVLFDAVIILVASPNQVATKDLPKVEEFIKDAFTHAKFIGYSDAVKSIIDKLGLTIDGGMSLVNDKKQLEAFLRQSQQLRFWDRELQLNGKI